MMRGDERVRSAFVSDLHLGSRHCQARELAAYLETLDCERLYLIGDVVDLWWLAKRRATWGPAQSRVLERIRALAELENVRKRAEKQVAAFCARRQLLHFLLAGLVLDASCVFGRIHRIVLGKALLGAVFLE